MEVNVLPILKNEGEKIFFSFNEAVGENIVEFCGETIKIVKPVAVSGSAVNYEGKINLHINIKTEVERVCSRCLKAYNEVLDINADYVYAKTIQNKDEDVYFFNKDYIDITDMVIGEITAQMPMKPLCKNDCEGLCPVCGNNKNISDCRCKKEETDPRLQILSSLLDKE